MKQKKENEMNETDKNQIRGVFWIVEGKLLAVPYDEEEAEGLSKNGFSYNHRLLWSRACPEGCRKRYDYYPRGRVEYTEYGKPVILIGHSVEKKYIPEIIEAFEIGEKPVIRYESSGHYMSEKERTEKHREKRRCHKTSRRNGLL